MTNKALISELTWRSLEMQKAAFPDMPHFLAPEELPNLLRPTTRISLPNIHVMSLGIVADNEKDFHQFYDQVKFQKAFITVEELGKTQRLRFCDIKYSEAYYMWKEARRNGVAKIGGIISAKLRRAQSLAAAEKIKDRWGLPSKTWPTKVLLEEANFSYNTAITIPGLGPRPIAQYNYKAKMKRKERAHAKG